MIIKYMHAGEDRWEGNWGGVPFLHMRPIILSYTPDPRYENTLNTTQMKTCVPKQLWQSHTVMSSADMPERHECTAWLCSPSLELCECASTSSLHPWVTASTTTNQEPRSGGHGPWIIRQRACMPQRQTRGGAAGAAAFSGLIWACPTTTTVFLEGEESSQPQPPFQWKQRAMKEMLLFSRIKPFLAFRCGQYVPMCFHRK